MDTQNAPSETEQPDKVAEEQKPKTAQQKKQEQPNPNGLKESDLALADFKIVTKDEDGKEQVLDVLGNDAVRIYVKDTFVEEYSLRDICVFTFAKNKKLFIGKTLQELDLNQPDPTPPTPEEKQIEILDALKVGDLYKGHHVIKIKTGKDNSKEIKMDDGTKYTIR
jgi:hypothetical protein